MKLDIGCGYKIREGYEGVDIKDFGQLYVTDVRKTKELEKISKGVTHIFCSHFLEHLTRGEAVDFLNTCHDIETLEELHIVVPEAGSPQSFTLIHHSLWSTRAFKDLEDENMWITYGVKCWDIVSMVVNERPDIHVKLKPK